jgi:predicted nucleotidyltransferase
MIPVPINTDGIPAFCSRWKVRQLSFIGSVLRPDFGPQSDVDVVIAFDPAATWDMFDIVRMKDELESLFSRPVDIIEEAAVRNPYMLDSIRRTKQVVYAA